MQKLNINEQLHSLYKSNWLSLCAAMEPILSDEMFGIKPTCPLLLSVQDEEEFKSADIRIMVYGQETNNWYKQFTSDLEVVLGFYRGFFNEDEWIQTRGQFWRGFSRFKSLIEAKYPEKKVRVLWNNIVKIGKHQAKGFPPGYIYEVEREYFCLTAAELDIIKPNVVLFLSGPNYDGILLDKFGHLDKSGIEPFTERQLAQIKLKGVDFAFRTYHPNYLWRNNIDSYFDAIIAQIEV